MVQSDDFSKVANYASMEGEGSLGTVGHYVTVGEATSWKYCQPKPSYTRIKVPEEDSDAFDLLLNRYFSKEEYSLESQALSGSWGYLVYDLWTTEEERDLLTDICDDNGIEMEIL